MLEGKKNLELQEIFKKSRALVVDDYEDIAVYQTDNIRTSQGRGTRRDYDNAFNRNELAALTPVPETSEDGITPNIPTNLGLFRLDDRDGHSK